MNALSVISSFRFFGGSPVTARIASTSRARSPSTNCLLETLTQIGFELQARDGAISHRWVEELAAGGHSNLCAMESRGGVAQDLFRAVIARRADGNPDAGGREQLVAVDVERFLERAPQPFGDA